MKKAIQNSSTHFLRAVVLLMGLGVLVLCGFLLPAFYREWADVFPYVAYLRFPAMIGLITTAVAFFVALWQTLKLLHYIDTSTAFSEASVNALGVIKVCALIISGLYVLALPLMYSLAQGEDAPGFGILGAFFVCAPVVIAVFATVLQRVLRDAIAIQKEHDLTV